MQIHAALVWPAIALVFAIVFSGIWRTDPVRRHLLGFGAGFFALFIAMAFHISVPPMNSALVVPILHGLSCLSVIAIIWGAANRLGQKIPLAALFALSAISAVALSFALRSSEHSIALIIQNGTSGLLFGTGAIILWSSRSTDFLDRMLVATISLLACFSFVRPLVILAMTTDLAALIEGQIKPQAINVVIVTLLTATLGGVLVAIALKEAIEIRYKTARIDPLSGLLDQRTFEQSCGLALRNGHRLDIPATLVLLEFDRFESLQEHWGKETVERVIREICDVVRSWQRESDIIGRVSEHRIGILFLGVSAHSSLSIIRSLRADIDDKLNETISGSLRITVSASIAQSRKGQDVTSLLRTALEPLTKHQMPGLSNTYVDGAETQPAPLGRPAGEAFVTLG